MCTRAYHRRHALANHACVVQLRPRLPRLLSRPPLQLILAEGARRMTTKRNTQPGNIVVLVSLQRTMMPWRDCFCFDVTYTPRVTHSACTCIPCIQRMNAECGDRAEEEPTGDGVSQLTGDVPPIPRCSLPHRCPACLFGFCLHFAFICPLLALFPSTFCRCFCRFLFVSCINRLLSIVNFRLMFSASRSGGRACVRASL